MTLSSLVQIIVGLVFVYVISSWIVEAVADTIIALLDLRGKHLKQTMIDYFSTEIDLQITCEFVNTIYRDSRMQPPKLELRELEGGLISSLVRRIKLKLNLSGYKTENRSRLPTSISSQAFTEILTRTIGLEFLAKRLEEVKLEELVDELISLIPTDVKEDNEVFQIFRQDLFYTLQLLKSEKTDFSVTIGLISESLDNLIQTYSEDESSKNVVYRISSIKRSIFGTENRRALNSLKSSLAEIVALVDQDSMRYKEVDKLYYRLTNESRPLTAQVNALIQDQIDDYRMGLDPNVIDRATKFEELDYSLQSKFSTNALKSLTEEEQLLYRNYQTYKQTLINLRQLPATVKGILVGCAQRAQKRIKQSQDAGSSFDYLCEEIERWVSGFLQYENLRFERERSAIRFFAAIFFIVLLNVDTLRIIDWLSTNPNSTANNKQAEISLPIMWNETNFTKQFDCPSAHATSILDLPRCISSSRRSSVRVLLGWLASHFAIYLGASFWLNLITQVKNIVK